jgi:short-subunit dehydrogenase
MTVMTFTRALVTGASSGIGEAFARRLAADGVELILVARSTSTLQALADELPVSAEVLTADLLDPADLLRVSTRLGQDPSIDLLVNNAGFGSSGPFVRADLDRELAQVQIHVLATMTLTQAALQAMVPRGTGGIINVSSMAGYQPLPNAATYAACKAFETSFTESVHLENLATGVHVQALCPGFVDTPMVAADPGTSRLPPRLLLGADTVAREGLEGIAVNKAVVVPGMAWKAAAAVSGSMPRSAKRLLMGVAGKLQ